MEKTVKKLMKIDEQIRLLKEEKEKLNKEVSDLINMTVNSYCIVFKNIWHKYRPVSIWQTIYTWPIVGNVKKFEIHDIKEDHFYALIISDIGDGEYARNIIKIPFDKEKIPQFTDEFCKKLELQAKNKIQKNTKEEKSKRKTLYKKLKKEFEKK